MIDHSNRDILCDEQEEDWKGSQKSSNHDLSMDLPQVPLTPVQAEFYNNMMRALQYFLLRDFEEISIVHDKEAELVHVKYESTLPHESHHFLINNIKLFMDIRKVPQKK